MKYLTLLFVILLVGLQAMTAQQVPPDIQYEINRQQRAARERKIAADLANRSAALGNLDRSRERSRRGDALALKDISKLYRLPTTEERSMLAPDIALAGKFSHFLDRGRSGLTKLMPDLGCDELTLRHTRSSDCDRYTMPGGGSGFSFRTGTHRQWLLADLIYDGRYFIAFGEFSQGFMTHLPHISIESVNLRADGIRFISDFIPAKQPDAVSAQNQKFVEGLRDGNFTYAKLLPVSEDGIYVLRSIAYRGRAIRRSLGGVEYNELDFDKRADIIAAFRVVRRSNDGSVTILWKELRRTESPRM